MRFLLCYLPHHVRTLFSAAQRHCCHFRATTATVPPKYPVCWREARTMA